MKLLDTLTTCYDRISVESGFKPFLLYTRDRILMTMVKIKLAITFYALAVLLELVVQTCSNYYFDTVLIVEEILRCVIFWPSKEDELKNMPRCFSQYRYTRAVLDCYKIPIAKKKCIKCRARPFSHYKKKFAAKVSMIVAPSGLITHVSDLFGSSD